MARLVLTYQDRTYQIGSDNTPFTIGRLPDNDLCLEFDTVSGSHGRIVARDGGLVYEDLDSTNGTYIRFQDGDEQFIHGRGIPLPGKGVIRFGRESGPEVSFYLTEGHVAGELEDESALETGLACLREGDYQKAFHLFEELIRNRADYLHAYYYAGFAASHLENLERSIVRFEQYLMLRPDDLDVLMDLGKVYERAGQLDRARNCYQKILDKDLKNTKAKKRLKEAARFQTGISPSYQKKKTREILGDDLVSTVDMSPFRVTYNLAAHGRILTDLMKVLKIVWQDVGQNLNYFPSEIIPVRLLSPHGDVSGKTGREGIVFMVDQEHLGERLFLSVLVAHEYAHYALGSMTGFSQNMPWWLQEGFAQHVSQNLTPGRLLQIKTLAQTDRLIPLTALENGLGSIEDREIISIAYLEAHTAVAFLIKQLGYEGLRSLIEVLNKEHKMSKAFNYIGTKYDRFEREWAKWLVESMESEVVKLTRRVK